MSGYPFNAPKAILISVDGGLLLIDWLLVGCSCASDVLHSGVYDQTAADFQAMRVLLYLLGQVIAKSRSHLNWRYL